MFTRITCFLVMAWALVPPTAACGQEVNSDVKIPPPRELVAGTPPISGLFVGTGALFASEGQLFGDAVAEAALGRLSERETRNELGNFMTSLLRPRSCSLHDGANAPRVSSNTRLDRSFSSRTIPLNYALDSVTMRK